MAILSYVYLADIAGTDVQLAHTTNPVLANDPPQSFIMNDHNPNDFTEKWYKKKSYGNNDSVWGLGGYLGNRYLAAVSEYPVESNELWLRFVDHSSYPSNSAAYWGGYWYEDTVFANFFNYSNGVRKLVARLVGLNPGTYGTPSPLAFDVYGDDGTTVVKRNIVANASHCRTDTGTQDSIVDLRFSFDKVAGFVQFYDYTATRVSEVLGQTINNLPVTHIVLYSSLMVPGGSYGNPVFRIVANEPTFGMYVMPFYAKAEGTDQDQISGSYARFTKSRGSFTPTIGVALEKPASGDTVRYSYVPKNLSEQGLPANYNVLSVQIGAVLDGTAATGDPIPYSTYLKQISTGTRFELPGQAIKNNVDFSISGSPQVRQARWDKNPITGQNWQPGDLSDFEIGFKI